MTSLCLQTLVWKLMMTLKVIPTRVRNLWHIAAAPNVKSRFNPWALQSKCPAPFSWQAGSRGAQLSCYLAPKSLHIVCKLIRSDLNCELASARQLAGCWGTQCLLNLHFLLETCEGEGKLWKSRETPPSWRQGYVQRRRNRASRCSRRQTRIPSNSGAGGTQPCTVLAMERSQSTLWRRAGSPIFSHLLAMLG